MLPEVASNTAKENCRIVTYETCKGHVLKGITLEQELLSAHLVFCIDIKSNVQPVLVVKERPFLLQAVEPPRCYAHEEHSCEYTCDDKATAQLEPPRIQNQ